MNPLELKLSLPNNIFLVGFMASGKSHVGRLLSERTGWPLVDTDKQIVQRAGKPVHQIFEEQGEATFRELERAAISEVCTNSEQVIATGGGAFVDPGNRKLMIESGLVFCLGVRPETVLKRISGGSDKARARKRKKDHSSIRPLLDVANPLERIQELLAVRAEAYSQAHYTIETDELSPEQVADRILQLCGPKKPKKEDRTVAR